MAAGDHLNAKQFGKFLSPTESLIKSVTAESGGGNVGIPNALNRPTAARLRSSRAWNDVDTTREAYMREMRVPN